jgi:hypothetical protein
MHKGVPVVSGLNVNQSGMKIAVASRVCPFHHAKRKQLTGFWVKSISSHACLVVRWFQLHRCFQGGGGGAGGVCVDSGSTSLWRSGASPNASVLEGFLLAHWYNPPRPTDAALAPRASTQSWQGAATQQSDKELEAETEKKKAVGDLGALHWQRVAAAAVLRPASDAVFVSQLPSNAADIGSAGEQQHCVYRLRFCVSAFYHRCLVTRNAL